MEALPLAGWDVAVTSARRGPDLVELLEQRGARVLHVPALRRAPLVEDRLREQATVEVLATDVDIVVVTTGNGFTDWLEAADAHGLGEPLRALLGRAEIYARGPRARGAVHAAGLQDVAAQPCESTWDLLGQLLSGDLHGRRVAVQLHGADIADFTRTLRTAGAQVLEVPVYRTAAPRDGEALERLVGRIIARELHAVTFTNAAAATNLLAAADRMDALDDLLDAFGDVLPACVGPVAAAPLERLSVPAVLPPQPRLGALAHAVSSALIARTVRLRVAGHVLEVRGAAAVVDGVLRPLPPGPMATLQALARDAGRVLSAEQLAAVLPGTPDARAAELAVSRLRAGLGDARCIRNVVKRGYRLDVESGSAVGEDDVDVPESAAPILDSVGGTNGLRVAVDLLYARLLADPVLSHFFAGVDMPRIKRHQVLLLAQLLGGRAPYAGLELAAAHAHLSIGDDEYRRVVDHLVAVLRELAVDPDAVAMLSRTLLDLQQDVVAVRMPEVSRR